MKKAFLTLAAVLLTGTAAFSQTSQLLSFSDGVDTPTAGSYNPTSTFSLTTTLTYSGYSSFGLSYWLQVPTALAPFLTITSATYSTFLTPIQPAYPKTFTDSSGASTGFLSDKGASDQGDLGATTGGQPAIAPGTYQITTLSFTLSGAPAGTYTLQSTTTVPKASEVTDTNFVSNNLAAATYTITVVPEPSSWALLAAGATTLLGVGAVRSRRRQQRA